MKIDDNFEKKKLYSLIVFFTYFIYLLMTINHIFVSKNFSFFAEISIYFVLMIIIKEFFRKTVRDGTVVVLALITSHCLYFIGLYEKIKHYIDSLFFINTNLIFFIFFMFIFFIGLYKLIKNGNKKILSFTLIILFLHGFYQLMLWNSFNQQVNVYEKIYYSASKNNIVLKECNTTLSCVKIEEKNIQEAFNIIVKNTDEKQPKKEIELYFKGFKNKIKKSKENYISYSYGDSVKYFRTDKYIPIGFYNKENGDLIINYEKGSVLLSNHYNTYQKLLGLSSFIWIMFLILTIFIHKIYVPKKRKEKNE